MPRVALDRMERDWRLRGELDDALLTVGDAFVLALDTSRRGLAISRRMLELAFATDASGVHKPAAAIAEEIVEVHGGVAAHVPVDAGVSPARVLDQMKFCAGGILATTSAARTGKWRGIGAPDVI